VGHKVLFGGIKHPEIAKWTDWIMHIYPRNNLFVCVNNWSDPLYFIADGFSNQKQIIPCESILHGK